MLTRCWAKLRPGGDTCPTKANVQEVRRGLPKTGDHIKRKTVGKYRVWATEQGLLAQRGLPSREALHRGLAANAWSILAVI